MAFVDCLSAATQHVPMLPPLVATPKELDAHRDEHQPHWDDSNTSITTLQVTSTSSRRRLLSGRAFRLRSMSQHPDQRPRVMSGVSCSECYWLDDHGTELAASPDDTEVGVSPTLGDVSAECISLSARAKCRSVTRAEWQLSSPPICQEERLVSYPDASEGNN